VGHMQSWYRPYEFNRTVFSKAVADFVKLLPELKKREPALTGIEGRKEPICQKELVAFTKGRMPWFVLPCIYLDRHLMREGETMHHSSVKTYSDPNYDFAVMSCLLVFKHHHGKDIKICSDSSLKGWKPAMDFVREQLGYTETWEFKEEKKGMLVDRFLVSKEAA
jgi:hypothetical protein